MPQPDSTKFTIRPASRDDAGRIAAHRRSMFVDMGHRDAAALNAMTVAFLPWLRQKMLAGEYLAWFAHGPDDSVAGGLGLWLMDWPPHMIGPGARRGNILNVYTEPSFRRQGIARLLMETALEWCRSNRIPTVILHASTEGRALYEQLGFSPSNEMRLLL